MQWRARLVWLLGQEGTAPPPIIPAEHAPCLHSCLQHVDEQEGLYTFRRPDSGAIECAFTDGEMLLLSVEGKHVAGGGWRQQGEAKGLWGGAWVAWPRV